MVSSRSYLRGKGSCRPQASQPVLFGNGWMVRTPGEAWDLHLIRQSSLLPAEASQGVGPRSFPILTSFALTKLIHANNVIPL